MPKESLLGFLDQDAFTRMINSVDYIPNTVERNNIAESMDSFIENVKGYYNLMDKIYQDLKNNNGLS